MLFRRYSRRLHKPIRAAGAGGRGGGPFALLAFFSRVRHFLRTTYSHNVMWLAAGEFIRQEQSQTKHPRAAADIVSAPSYIHIRALDFPLNVWSQTFVLKRGRH